MPAPATREAPFLLPSRKAGGAGGGDVVSNLKIPQHQTNNQTTHSPKINHHKAPIGAEPLSSRSQDLRLSPGARRVRIPPGAPTRSRVSLLVSVDSEHRSTKPVVQVRFLAGRPSRPPRRERSSSWWNWHTPQAENLRASAHEGSIPSDDTEAAASKRHGMHYVIVVELGIHRRLRPGGASAHEGSITSDDTGASASKRHGTHYVVVVEWHTPPAQTRWRFGA